MAIDFGNVNVTNVRLIDGNAMNPSVDDTLLLEGTLDVGEPVPDGWRVTTGNMINSKIFTVAMRYEVEEREKQ